MDNENETTPRRGQAGDLESNGWQGVVHKFAGLEPGEPLSRHGGRHAGRQKC